MGYMLRQDKLLSDILEGRVLGKRKEEEGFS